LTTVESPATRLTPLPDDQWNDRIIAALTVLVPEHRRNPRGVGTALGTLARHPDLLAAFNAFNKHLIIDTTVPPRLRELAILRIARRRECAYEWIHHEKWAARMGLSAAEIEAAGNGKSEDELASAVLAAVDELDGTSRLTDATWGTLRAHLDEHQLMDLVFTITGYLMVALSFNAFGIQPEG
jgi:AhpD family alkylhydroperoxidase